MPRINIGHLLLKEHLTDQSTLDQAADIQKKTGEKIGQILISMGVISEEQLLNLLAAQLKIPYIDLNLYEIDLSLCKMLSEIQARRYRALVLERLDGHLLIGMADPQDINALDGLSQILNDPIKLAIVSENALLPMLDKIYRRTEEITHFAKELSSKMIDTNTDLKDDLFADTSDAYEKAPVAKLLNSIFRDAIQARASDIHIEPDEALLRIRFRIDGVLNESVLDDKRIISALIQRIKLLSNLDIAEKRIPQDGRFNFTINQSHFDVRVSTLPTIHGESLVMRLLDQSAPVSDLNQLGIPSGLVTRIEAIYNKPYGMLLVTGPTGSGKTTTLYSILSRLNIPDRKIITVEDPVEYHISRINQVQVNPKIKLTFAAALRSILRQDPDIILIGEIRDTETASIAMRAAVTGHLVLASLHANDALSTAIRLIDMGIEGYMVASAVNAIIAQRLIRLLCKVCMEDYKPDERELAWLAFVGYQEGGHFKQAVGCSHCGHRGYSGRTGIYELLELNYEMLDALRLNDASRFAKVALNNEAYQPLAKSVLSLIVNGETSITEAIRVLGHLDEEFSIKAHNKTENAETAGYQISFGQP